MSDYIDAGEGPSGYSSYLLRLWQFDRGGEVVWRVAVTRTDGGEEVILAGLGELADYLSEEAGSGAKQA